MEGPDDEAELAVVARAAASVSAGTTDTAAPAGGTADGGPASGGTGRLVVEQAILEAMIAHCLAAYPEEGCGLLVGEPAGGRLARCVPTGNAARSAALYTVEPRDHLVADREAEAEGRAIVGVFHSHTHTDPYPSPTDVAQAPDPSWHYVLVSLRHELPSVRSYRIVEGRIDEEEVVVVPAAGGADAGE